MAKSSTSDPSRQYLAPTDPGLGLLALASGSTDVMSFLALGNTFTSAMTGNTALLAIAIGRGHFVSALLSSLALVGFILGVAVATAIYNPRKGSVRAVLRPLFLLEITCLGGFVVAWHFVDRASETFGLEILILLSAIAMGIQAVVARHINAPGINTIVFTSTLVSIVMSVTGALARPSLHPPVGPTTLRQIGIFLAYGLGGLCAAYLWWRQIPLIQWLPFIAVTGAIVCCELALATDEK
jgi:uncharacterized membrane protein YoaK (UPF0700 family)